MEITKEDFESAKTECGEIVPEIPITERARQRVVSRSDTNFVVRSDNEPVAFLVGYDEPDHFFYVYLFGVVPGSRGGGVGSGLLEHVEQWASASGYTGIRLQSRNKYPDMLRLVIGRGYHIVAFVNRGDIDTSPIRFEKEL